MSTRRGFLKSSGMMAAGLGLSHHFTEELSAAVPGVKKSYAASDRVNIGVIGIRMGWENLNETLPANPGSQFVAVCDVNTNRMTSQVARLKKDFPEQTKQVKEYTDFRKMLENKDIDAVMICTPDHWHAYMFNEVLKAGKAIYIEKPIAKTIAECNKMMELQNRYKQVVTTGLWHANQPYFLQAFEILKTGVLGDVYKVHCFVTTTTNPRPFVADEPVPDYLDYEMFLGPAPVRPYNSVRYGVWRHFWDYGGGLQCDWGPHLLDSAFDGIKALGLINGYTYPKSIVSSAYKHPKSFVETPSCLSAILEYENFHVEWTQQVANLYGTHQGVAWIGSNATLVCNREGIQLIPQKDRDGKTTVEPIDTPNPRRYISGITQHSRNWVECIRNGNIHTSSPLEKGVFATILSHSSNISHLTGMKLTYDPITQRFVNNPLADSYLKPVYRKPWDSLWNE